MTSFNLITKIISFRRCKELILKFPLHQNKTNRKHIILELDGLPIQSYELNTTCNVGLAMVEFLNLPKWQFTCRLFESTFKNNATPKMNMYLFVWRPTVPIKQNQIVLYFSLTVHSNVANVNQLIWTKTRKYINCL